jgi:GAF domain-containing protein
MATLRGARLTLGAEAALAFGAAAAFFLLAAAIPIRGHLVLILLLGGVYVYVVLAVASRLGPLYAVPLAIAGGLAFDSFYIPPTREFGAADWQNWLVVAIYILMGVLIGLLGARSGRRAESADLARGVLASEHAALRRVATLVAEGVAAPELMTAVAKEAGTLLDVDGAWIEYYQDEEVVTTAQWSKPGKDPPTFDRARVEEAPVAAAVRRTGRVARIDDSEDVQPRPILARRPGRVSLVGAPISVEGAQWGLLLAWSQDAPLPGDAEEHLTAFTELVATAIANSDARAQLSRLADQQAALRRVATLVAEGVAAPRLFEAVAEEAGKVLEVDGARIATYDGEDVVSSAEWSKSGHDPPTFDRVRVDEAPVAGEVRRTGRVVRFDDFERVQGGTVFADQPRVTSLVGAPIIVEGDQWGVMIAWSQDSPLPPDAAAHLTAFTDLVATAIANSDARAQVSRLADQQAALRRVATLVAREVSPEELFNSVCDEVERLLGIEEVDMVRLEGDGTFTVLSFAGKKVGEYPVGSRLAIEGRNAISLVVETERPARIDDYSTASGTMGEIAKSEGVRGVVGCPIVVQGRLWGVAVAATRREDPLPADSEARIGEFTELVATAIANAEARREVATLADEQAALRRVATLVAEGVPPPEVFAAVTRELGHFLGVDSTHLARYEPDGTVTGVGGWSPQGANAPVGIRVPLDDTTVTGLVHESGRPARLDGYGRGSGEVRELIEGLGIRSSVGAPITVDGQPWGVMIASSNRPEPLPGDTEARIAAFTDLVATAISNTESRAETRRLAEEQAALRRVATLVAEAVPASDLFSGVAAEVGSLLGAELATLFRYEDEHRVRMLSIWTADGVLLETPETWRVQELVLSRSTAEDNWPGRVDDWTQFSGPLAQFVRDVAGVTSSVSSPIVVEGQLWGGLAVHSTQDDPLPAGTEVRVSEFTELIATAISNVDAREDLAASRARIVAAADDERRRVVRDLHDGAQQRLVHTIVTLNLARSAIEEEREEAADLVSEAARRAEEATGELRELAHGILPSVLTRGGLPAGVRALASRMPVPVETDVSVDRLPAEVEATAYFVVAEALTNVAKHARAEQASVKAHMTDGQLRIQVADDGVGGADREGSGFLGLGDRLAVHDGTLRVESPAEGGTRVVAAIPVR